MRAFSNGLTYRLMACAVVAAVASHPALAARDPLIEGGKLCTQQFPKQEQVYTIPTHLLAAISTTESGRFHKGLGMSVPWPWTINVEGKGYYFDTKAEAIAQTQSLIARGHKSIDVGCMQVNLKHHPKAFADLNQAFDPASNVGYAAKFLRDNYATLGDWIKATAAYHSRTSVHGQRYLGEIERSWNKIVAKVAAARANQGHVVNTASASQPQTPVMRPINSTRGVRQIAVNNAPKKASDVVVIRPTNAVVKPMVTAAVEPEAPIAPTPTAAVIAAATPVDSPVVATPAATPGRWVTLDNPPATLQPATQSKPTFVFN